MYMPESLQKLFDYLSIGTVVGAIIGILPSIATILTIVWMVIRIYETKTVQKILGKSNDKKG